MVAFQNMSNSVNDNLNLLKRLVEKYSDEELKELYSWLQDLRRTECRPRGEPDFRQYLLRDFERTLADAGLNGGRVLEIGGPYNSFGKHMPDYQFSYVSLYPSRDFDNVIVGDITQADHVPDESFDAILSVSVLEHVSKPARAAEHMTRILKPGGVMYHAAPFSYFYHGAPADFFRYTTDGMKALFPALKPVKCKFFGRNRRRDNRGSKHNPVDRDGGEQFAVDAFGGWRENWYVIFAGIKDEEWAREKLEQNRHQVLINLVKVLWEQGADEEKAILLAVETLGRYRVNHDQELHALAPGEKGNLNFGVEEAERIWRLRGRREPRPSWNRYVMAQRAGLLE